MGACKDPRLTYLNDFGYNVVRLPRRGIGPLGVIGRDDRSRSWLGTLDQIWTSPLPVPTPGEPQPVSGLQGSKTSDLKLSVGLEILANALGGMFGGTAPSVDFAYKDAKFVQFAFHDVRSVSIDPFVIGNFLAKGNLASDNPVVRRFFTDQKNVRTLVVTDVLEAKSIGVIGKRDSTTDIAVNVPQIQAALGARVGVTLGSSSANEVKFEGPDYLVFGFKAFGIARADGHWQMYGLSPQEELAFSTADEQPPPVVERDELVDLDFPMPAAVR
jgi:hypothetical protein